MAWSLLQAGQNTKQNAMSSMNTLANEEQKRNIANKNLETQHKQDIATGVGAGASMGMAFGPVGAGVGAVVGGLAAALF